MIISDTSALVLNFTSPDIWKSKNARVYFDKLDLSSADDLLKMFDEEELYMQTQLVSNRKYFVRKKIIEFLEKNNSQNHSAQVIILAAGIAPLSVEIASLFPTCKVFDIDKYQMQDKNKFLDNLCPNIQFIEVDITDLQGLTTKLTALGWNEHEPSLLVMEGIIYYISENDLKSIFNKFAPVAGLIGDFCLKPEWVNEKTRKFGVDVFRKIKETTGVEYTNFYDPLHFTGLLKKCGFSNPEIITMNLIQFERTGKLAPFNNDDSGWIILISSSYIGKPN